MTTNPGGDPSPRYFALLCFAFLIVAGGWVAASRVAMAAKPSPPDVQSQLSSLQEQVKQLQNLVPNQPTVMTHVAYHFTNLWFAATDGNWPLAAYYVGEVRSNLKWAVRVRPVRIGPSGEVNLAGIAEAIENTELTQLQKAVEIKDGESFVNAYNDTIMACDSCHQAIGKPYLRVQRPSSPEVQLLNLGRGAKPTVQLLR